MIFGHCTLSRYGLSVRRGIALHIVTDQRSEPALAAAVIVSSISSRSWQHYIAISRGCSSRRPSPNALLGQTARPPHHRNRRDETCTAIYAAAVDIAICHLPYQSAASATTEPPPVTSCLCRRAFSRLWCWPFGCRRHCGHFS